MRKSLIIFAFLFAPLVAYAFDIESIYAEHETIINIIVAILTILNFVLFLLKFRYAKRILLALTIFLFLIFGLYKVGSYFLSWLQEYEHSYITYFNFIVAILATLFGTGIYELLKRLGEVSSSNSQKAIETFESLLPLAEQGNAEAQYKVGMFYYAGEGGALQNYREAVKWNFEAAKQGYANAQFALSVMYKNGHGFLSYSVKKSYMWAIIAKSNGHDEAQKIIEELKHQMPRYDIEEAQFFAKRCVESNYKECNGEGDLLP